MARKEQFLINYHTSSAQSMPSSGDTRLGEIIVRHATEKPELLIQLNDGTFAVFQDSGAVNTAIENAVNASELEIDNRIGAVAKDLENHESEFETYKTTASETFATKNELSGLNTNIENEFINVKTEIYNSATTFTTNAINSVKNELADDIEAVDAKVLAVSGDLKAYKTEVAGTYETKVNVENAIDGAKTEVYNSSSALTYAAVEAAKKASSAYTNDQINALEARVSDEIEAVDAKVLAVSGDLKAYKTEVAGTYETKANVEAAINSAKTEVYNSSSALTHTAVEAAKVASSAYTDAQISALNNTLSGEIDAVDAKAGVISGNLETFKAEVASTYATKTGTTNEISAAVEAAKKASSAYTDSQIAAAKVASSAYTDAQISALNATLSGEIDAVDAKAGVISGNLETFKTFVSTTYETKVNVEAAINSAKTEVYNSSSALTHAAVEAAKVASSAYTNDQINALEARVSDEIEAVDAKVIAFSAATVAELSSLEGELTEVINTKVASAYIYKGSCTYANLPKNYTSAETGFVWNVTDANGNFPAGTNYAWTGTAWDALGGSIDLEPYALTTYVDAAEERLTDEIEAVDAKVLAVSGDLISFKTFVAETYATKNGTTNEISAAVEAAKKASSAYTDSQIAAAKIASSAYTDAQISALNNTLSDEIDGVAAQAKKDVDAVSAVTKTAIQTASIATGDTTNVSIVKEGTNLKFDFSNMIIDCGDF